MPRFWISVFNFIFALVFVALLASLIPDKKCLEFGGTCTSLAFQIVMQIAIMPFGILLALQYDSIGEPKLEISIAEAADMESRDFGHIRHLYLYVANRPDRAPLVRRRSATNCYGTLSVLALDGTVIFEEMPLRWSENAEPYKFEFDPSSGTPRGILDVSLLRPSRFSTIPRDSREKIDTGMRIKGDNEAYGWTDASYVSGPRNDKFKIPQGDYIIRVQIKSDEKVFSPKEFLLTNPEDFEGFALRELPKKQFFKRRTK